MNARRSSLPVTLLLAAAALCAPILRGQSAHWDPPGGSLPVGEVSQLQLVFDDCSPDDTPVPPKVDGLTLDNQGQSSSISIINGTFSRTVSVTFAALLSKQQQVEVPAFTVATNKGPVQVPAVRFGPANATLGTTGVALSSAVASRMEVAPPSVWAGQVFDLKYSIDVGEGYYPNWGRGTFEWDASPLVAEDWSQPEPYDADSDGPRKGLAYKTRAIARTAGRISLNAPSQLVNLSVGVSGFGFFQQRQYQQFSVTGNAPALDVRPLPPAPAPAGFTGAVGEFKVASKVVPTRVGAGEPITWTVELSGTGNWPEIRGLPARQVSSDFQTVQPKPKRTQPQGKLFEGTLSEDVVLLPTQAGTYDLPPLDFTYFDPQSGTYRVITAPGATVVVDPAAAPAAAPAQPPPGAPAPAITVPSLQPEAKAPELPTGALGDPIAPSGPAPALLGGRAVAAGLAAPFALLILLWVALAYRRARLTDPLRQTRAARVRLGATLLAMRTAPAAGKVPLLIAWQRDSAVLLGIANAAPRAAELADPAWSALWSEADRCLYSRDPALSPDWVARASAALDERKLRRFSAARLLLPQNLLPFLALVLAAAGAPRLLAADPADAYRKGDFAAAAGAWGERLGADPLDWSARHNLSLALAQQDRWAEAAVQASAAFVQSPSDPAVRRQLALACDKADFVPEPLDFLMQPGPVQSLARLESPGGWQLAGIASAALAAAALALALASSYGRPRGAWVMPATLGVLALSLALGAASLVGFRAYGILADTRAVVVWRSGTLRSIPTEADVSQKTTALAAGSSAIVDREFLGWVRLAFANGESGWVEASEVIYLWRPPPAG